MYCVGISLNARDLKAAVLKREKGKLSLDSLQAFPLEAVKLFYTLPPFQSSSPVTVASGLSGSDVLTRRLQLPLENKRKILAALPFQLEAILPYPCESALICSLIYPMRAQTTPVTVLATTVESLQTHLSELKKIEIQTDVVCCDPVALARFSHWQFPEELRILGLHVEGNQLLYVLREAGEVVLSQTLEFEGLELELEKLSIFLKQKGLIDDQTPWVLTGKIEQEALFRAVFSGRQLEVEAELAHYALAIGYALDAFAEDAFSVQFCQKKFTLEHTAKRRNRLGFIYLGSCLACALAALLFGQINLGKKQRQFLEKIQGNLPASLALSSSFSEDAIEETFSQWQSSLHRQKNEFPFLPTVPPLSDVLAWVSTHPAFSTEEGGKREGIEVQSLHYQLVKYPKIKDTKIPYQATLSLEFTAETPRLARDFHEALLKGDALVNHKKEVRWQTQGKSYFTSFELNPVRTR